MTSRDIGRDVGRGAHRCPETPWPQKPILIIESVDSISRNGLDTPYMLYIRKPKYLRASKLVKFLTYIIIISSKFTIY